MSAWPEGLFAQEEKRGYSISIPKLREIGLDPEIVKGSINQSEFRALAAVAARWPEETPTREIVEAAGFQYNARIFGLRRKLLRPCGLDLVSVRHAGDPRGKTAFKIERTREG